jgi:hypothetical protein
MKLYLLSCAKKLATKNGKCFHALLIYALMDRTQDVERIVAPSLIWHVRNDCNNFHPSQVAVNPRRDQLPILTL